MSDYLSKMSRRRKKRNTIRRTIITMCLLLVVVAFFMPVDGGEGSASSSYSSQLPVNWDEYAVAATNPDLDEVIVDYKGFKVSFNPVTHIPNWVAWTITADRLNNPVVSRNSASFTPDRRVSG